jgi:ABC-type transport system involved in multi-copper enzyme maturation permease subunit
LVLAADYPFLSILWTMLVFFCWVAWFWLLIIIFGDIFRRHDASGVTKVLWMIFIILVPFLGVFVYVIVNNHGMTERRLAAQQAKQRQFDAYVQSVATSEGATAEIARAKELLDSGAITQSEFDAIKRKALA